MLPETHDSNNDCDELIYHYTFPKPAPFVLPTRESALEELKTRLPRLEAAMVKDGSATCSPDAAIMLLALQLLRSVPDAVPGVEAASDPLHLAVAHSALVTTMLTICACDDTVWCPSPQWPHSKGAMLRSIVDEDESERVSCQFKSEVRAA